MRRTRSRSGRLRWALAGMFLAMVVVLISCGYPRSSSSDDSASPGPAAGQLLASEKQRDAATATAGSDMEALAAGNASLALGLFSHLTADSSNLVFSPHTVSVLLAQAYAGARGQTKDEIARAASFTLPEDRLHAAFNTLDQDLAARYGATAGGGSGTLVRTANSLWGQEGLAYVPAFLDTLSQYYGAGLRVVDFAHDLEGARRSINEWAAEATDGKIPEVVPRGKIDDGCLLAAASAIYLRAFWEEPFRGGRTDSAAFHLLDQRTVQVQMMRRQEISSFPYAQGDGWQAIELPYQDGQLSCLVLLPDEGGFTPFAGAFTGDRLSDVLSRLEETRVILSLPKFRFESELDLVPVLTALGMKTAFTHAANFSGIFKDMGGIWIDGVRQRAVIAVDELGTEAAAVTVMTWAASATTTDRPPVVLTVDRPFIFLLRDKATGAILFLGQVTDPRE